MAKPIKVYDEYRIVVIPALYRQLKEEFHPHNQRTCEDVVKEINRHVDGIDNVYIEKEFHLECPYCHLGWEDDDDGSPMCCQRAWDDWAKEVGCYPNLVNEGTLIHDLEVVLSKKS